MISSEHLYFYLCLKLKFYNFKLIYISQNNTIKYSEIKTNHSNWREKKTQPPAQILKPCFEDFSVHSLNKRNKQIHSTANTPCNFHFLCHQCHINCHDPSRTIRDGLTKVIISCACMNKKQFLLSYPTQGEVWPCHVPPNLVTSALLNSPKSLANISHEVNKNNSKQSHTKIPLICFEIKHEVKHINETS